MDHLIATTLDLIMTPLSDSISMRISHSNLQRNGTTIDCQERERERERENSFAKSNNDTNKSKQQNTVAGCQRSISLSMLSAYDNQNQ